MAFLKHQLINISYCVLSNGSRRAEQTTSKGNGGLYFRIFHHKEQDLPVFRLFAVSLETFVPWQEFICTLLALSWVFAHPDCGYCTAGASLRQYCETAHHNQAHVVPRQQKSHKHLKLSPISQLSERHPSLGWFPAWLALATVDQVFLEAEAAVIILHKVHNMWNSLQQGVLMASSLNGFKMGLAKPLHRGQICQWLLVRMAICRCVCSGE